ncbi:hypothetical protein PAAG_00893 [Paracoccidioides lutzii Pb01]|uniref:Zn(2)-C6 fungal-type domain-containing protein n=1 Tax=Paracoccidioides lutzii (strain ATCC MYA-826 / Pb01) TaxID=502779 RepID=C1GQU8_PARBA|nr:hypothetical protein PAAG_00893 [Paracoccidioides lutzii Pb01]EEH37972.2 hypothetical protein PAAG_00893 [Paracoccidioides lutzii Pb01]
METITTAPNAHLQRKRKADDNGHLNTKKPAQKRASAACRSCRARKVRCDVLIKNIPCTNCRLDGGECAIAESKRTKFARTADGTTLLTGQLQRDADGKGWNAGNTMPSEELIKIPECGSVEQSHAQEFDTNVCEFQQQSTPDPILAHDMVLSNMFSIMRQLFGPIPDPVNKHMEIELPRYIKHYPTQLEPDDLKYLQTKGAFRIPHFALRNELLKNFINYVHVYMPFLDLEDFLQTIYENNGRKQISLLLFQAVMFAGTAFVDMKHLRMAGYQSRREARKAFFQRVRALYDLDYEDDQIVVIQVLLLMSYWFETPHDQKDSWHWTGISLALSRLNGLHLDITTSGMDTKTRRVWRRIWWTLYSRDKTIALGTRRPTRIRADEHDVEMVSTGDFEFRSFPAHLQQMIGGSEILSSPDYQRKLVLMFIEKIKLCCHLQQVLSVQYRILRHKTRGGKMVLVPKRESVDISQIKHHDEVLDEWFADIPEETRYSPRFGCELSEGEEVLHLHRGMLKLLYLATRSTLHLPQIIRGLPNTLLSCELQQGSLEKVRQTAAEITSIAQDLHHLNLTRYLPSNGTTPLLSAVATHVMDLASPSPGIKANSLNRLQQCLQTLLRLREIYPAADALTNSLEKIMGVMGMQQLYTCKPWTQGEVLSSDYYYRASVERDRYGPMSSPKPCPPSLMILDSIAKHPLVREGSSVSESESGNENESVNRYLNEYEDEAMNTNADGDVTSPPGHSNSENFSEFSTEQTTPLQNSTELELEPESKAILDNLDIANLEEFEGGSFESMLEEFAGHYGIFETGCMMEGNGVDATSWDNSDGGMGDQSKGDDEKDEMNDHIPVDEKMNEKFNAAV